MLRSGCERAELKPIEFVLTTSMVLLKLYVLYATWGRIQGFDALPWLDVFRVTRWFEPLPGPKMLFYSYHPPLSYLLCRWIYAVYPHELEASQILSTLAIIGVAFALRSTLRTIGVLWTLPGLAMLYVSASIPLVVAMSVETSSDPVLFMWFTVTLAISAKLLWRATPAVWWRRPGYVAGVLGLGLALAAGLLTKFNAAFAFGLPFLVILARGGSRSLRREFRAPVLAATIGILLIAPFYYLHYYKPLGQIFPQPMEWMRADDLKAALKVRDANPWRFVTHVIRVPVEPITGTQDPVTDSFVHSIWLQIWKRDAALGRQGDLSLVVSDLYVRSFPVVVLASTLRFLIRRRTLPRAWRQLGHVLLPVSVMFCLALLYFGWKYPLWDWRIFKAKYIAPAVLWIPYCVTLPFVSSSTSWARMARWNELRTNAVALLLMLFMFVNHLLPVY
jgi:4-amino-4-deoxy-L-arabinose transferase-like glycosyltransferase